MYRIMIFLGVVLSAVQASAECAAPRETLFACDFTNSNKRVEVCAILDAGDMDYKE